MTVEESVDPREQEIRTLIGGALRQAGVDDVERLAANVQSHFAIVTPPQLILGEISTNAEMFRIKPGGLDGGTSVKPGNIVLNWRKLFTAIGSGTLTIAGSIATPWMLVPGALLVFESLWSSAKIEVGEIQACVMWTLWNMRDASSTVGKAEVFEAVNRERSGFGKQPLSEKEVNFALRDLERIGCIKQSKRDPDRWWLQDWVRVKY